MLKLIKHPFKEEVLYTKLPLLKKHIKKNNIYLLNYQMEYFALAC